MKDTTAYVATMTALGVPDGYILDWRSTGCQYVSYRYRDLLTCPFREARWRCEVIGPHTVHRWSEHLMVHERLGNGYRCSAIGDMTLDGMFRKMDRVSTSYPGMRGSSR